MKHTAHLLLAVAGLILGVTANAATLSLTDGSRLQGELVTIHEGKIVFKTAFAGELKIPQEQVVGIDSSTPVSLRTQAGEVFVGPVSTDASGKVTVTSASGTVSTGVGSVVSAWKPGETDPVSRSREAAIEGKLRHWSYTAGVDISGASGNSENLGSAMQVEAKLEGPQDRLIMYGSYKYKETENVRSEDEQKGGMRYTNFFTSRWGWFIREELERDTFEGIDFRSTTAGGLTYKFINRERMQLEGSGGLSYRYESYADPLVADDGFPGLDFGLDFGWQFADWGKLVSKVRYIPSIDDFGDYLIEHESGVDIPLGTSDMWTMRFGVSNQYNSNPNPGREDLDTTYFTRLMLSWQ